MKIVIVSTQDIHGGGYVAAYRLKKGLQAAGLSICMLVQNKKSDDATVHIAFDSIQGKLVNPFRGKLEYLPLYLYPKREKKHFSPAWLFGDIAQRPELRQADVVNLHWICGGYIRPEQLIQFKKPIVWTLHDMWPFTGGCHFAGTCMRFEQSCGMCPQLCSQHEHDLSRWLWWRKQRSWHNLKITIVAPSRWLGKCASLSSLFRNQRVEIIPYGLNTDLFNPRGDKSVLRRMLGLPLDKTLILSGSMGGTSDERKGHRYLKEALDKLIQSGNGKGIEIVLFGPADHQACSEIRVPVHHLGRLYDEISIATCYAVADLFVCPSIEDNLPNTILESFACGLPVIAFDIGGIPDIVEHKINGYLAQPFSAEDLSDGIAWILANPDRSRMLAENARTKALKEYALDIQAKRYRMLFEEIVRP